MVADNVVEIKDVAVVGEPEKITDHAEPPSGEDAYNTLYCDAMEIQEKCKDVLCPVNEFEVYHKDGMPIISCEGKLDNSTFTPFSLSQLCTKLGVPARYVQRCFNEDDDAMHDLATLNLNSWLERYDSESQFLIRKYGDSVRGVLSDRFSTLDAPVIMEELFNVLPTEVIDKSLLKGHFISPERFHARILLGNLSVPNEVLFYGMQIDSSDVGRSMLKVQFLIYKLVCTNGLVLPKASGMLFNQKHVGLDKDEFISEFQQSISKIPDLVALTERQISLAQGVMLNNDAYERILMKARMDLKFSEDVAERISEKVVQRYDMTRWGVVNALTDVAQEFTLERRLEFEAAAGRLLVLSHAA